MFRKFLTILLGIPFLLVCLHTLVRIVRHFYKFPMPQFLADLIDNPLRRKIQPPDETAIRHGLRPGMRVLEVGPGSGTYTLAAARLLQDTGQLVTIDIEPKMIERVERRIAAAGVRNIDARVANVYNLPFDERSFDLVYMITVIGEIPDPIRAMAEFHRLLKDDGRLVFSEILLDPDYPLASSLAQKARAAGFRLREKIGNFFYYTLVFKKA